MMTYEEMEDFPADANHLAGVNIAQSDVGGFSR